MADRRPSITRAAELVKNFKPFQATPYLGSDRIWEVGHGHTRTVRGGMQITQARADQLLHDDLEIRDRLLWSAVVVPLSISQCAALLSFLSDISMGTFEKSRLRSLLNRGWYDAVPPLLLEYSCTAGRRSLHRAAWRAAEARLWKMPVAQVSEKQPNLEECA